MREKPKYIPKIDEKASIIVTDGECYLDSESNIVGIEISFYGNAEITPQLPDGWIMQGNNRKMLIFRMSGSPIQKRLLFTYTGSVNITKSMIINDKAEKVSEKNKQDKSKWNEDNFQFDSDTTKWIARKNYNSNGKVKKTKYNLPDYNFPKVENIDKSKKRIIRSVSKNNMPNDNGIRRTKGGY